MLNPEKFTKVVDDKFWRHVLTDTDLPFSEKQISMSRRDYLKKLAVRINKMTYSPKPPRGWILSHKSNLVIRFVPALTMEDYCVYYYCLKELEAFLAENRVNGTYGGWKLGGAIRRKENLDYLDAPSVVSGAFTKFYWNKAWKDYQKHARGLMFDDKNLYFVQFDIANFYDCINLSKLESSIRLTCDKSKHGIINLLMFFLSTWNKQRSRYEKQTVGIPQDEVGDCSRILANYYLQTYDDKLKKLTERKNAKYLRFADDQIIAAEDENTLREIMFIASKELADLGLNLNAYKVKFFNKEKFSIYWSFDIFEKMQDVSDVENLTAAYILYKKRLSEGVEFKPESILKRFLSCELILLPQAIRDDLLSSMQTDGFLLNSSFYHLKKIYSLLDIDGKEKFLTKLNELGERVYITQFHLRVLRLVRDVGADQGFAKKASKQLRRSEFILKLSDYPSA